VTRPRRLVAAGLLMLGPALCLPALAVPALSLAVPGLSLPAAAAAGASGSVEVAMDHATAAGVLGDHLTIGSTVTNAGAGSSGPLLAHLDVVSRDNDVYVDPEDWSGSRTVQLEPLGAGERRTLSWTVHNVEAGEFDVYVVLLLGDPASGPGSSGPGTSGPGTLVVGPPVLLTVVGRRTLDPGNSLAVVVAVPVVLAALTAAGRLRRRRRR
jgi:hypothetical protein